MAFICDTCGKLHFPLEKPDAPLRTPRVNPCHGLDNLIEIDDRFATQLQKMRWYKQYQRIKTERSAAAKQRYARKKANQ